MVLIYSLFFITAFINCIYGAVKKKNLILYGFSLAVIFLLMAFNIGGPDIGVYISSYEEVGNAPDLHSVFNSTYMEYGYTFLMFIANNLGLNFFSFRIVLTLACLGLFASAIKYYKVNPNFIVGLYMIYLFFFDTIQLRNCIIEFIILFATRYLFQKSGISLLKYILCIFIAGSIHSIAYLFLSLLLIRFVRSEKGYKRIFALAALFFIVCVLLRPVLPQIINALAKLINRGSSYFHSTVRFSYFIVMFFYLLGFVPLYWYRNKVTDPNVKNKIEYIIKINTIMGLFLPLCFINSSFYRIFRNIVVLDTIGLSLLYANTEKRTSAKNIAMSAQILLVGGWLVVDLARNSEMDIIGFALKCNLIYSSVNFADFAEYAIVIVLCLLAIFVINNFYNSSRNKPLGRGMKCD